MKNKFVRTYEVFSKDECKDFVTRVFALKHLWYKRTLPSLEAFSEIYNLGRPIADKFSSGDKYFQNYPLANNLLLEHFFDFYCVYIARLEEVLNSPVAFADDASLPGCNIIREHSLQCQLPDRWHIDLDHKYIDSLKDADPEQVISFTLPICLPVHGAGVDIGLEKNSKIEFLEQVRYKVGSVYLINGLVPHRISPPPLHCPSDSWRITFQSFGFFNKGSWVLYW